ncbi:MAG: tyrosine 3-monooxygenase [Parcubacteria group bacterium Greene0714_7]|nr:MAG: tyrosine 3-monooxygenase [Parcubacteria group bacterium Greene0714_7]
MKPTKKDITLLSLDHPGANDLTYRKRRKFIADKADAFLENPTLFPRIRYNKKERETWHTVLKNLAPLHAHHASSTYLDAKEKLKLTKQEIPQLYELSERLQKLNNFQVEPIGGLVDVRWFLGSLGRRIMISTQYLRHHSRPDYTPEPDMIHEVVGHIPMFVNQDFAHFSERLGKAALKASKQQLRHIETLYWFTVEFGLIKERGVVKAFGAGLLSSFGEMPHAFSKHVTRKPFSVEEIIKTPYVYTEMQKTLFVIPSFSVLQKETEKFLRREGL